MNPAWLLRFAALSGFASVALGAFGAHLLKSRLTPDDLEIFETGVRYQMYHAIAAACVALAMGATGRSRPLAIAGWSFVVGTIVFSGSLYLLVLTGTRALGAATPIGGVALLIGWASLAAVRLPRSEAAESIASESL
jgi:uncharacterized membrane protein YgdD (TMEM256/DUF423 family)